MCFIIILENIIILLINAQANSRYSYNFLFIKRYIYAKEFLNPINITLNYFLAIITNNNKAFLVFRLY
jgi:hypothetical protein